VVALVVATLLLGTCGLVVLRRPRQAVPLTMVETAPRFPRRLPAIVESASWQRVVEVQRYQLVRREGFADQRPAEARDVKPLGPRVHHVDEVPDGFRAETYEEEVQVGTRTETYSERVQDGFDTERYTERVQSGTRSESYTEQERCGEDCRTSTRTCRQSCTSKKNGFATCKDVCTGGDRTCTPKYCSRTKTRQVPDYKDVQKTRQVARYKDVQRTRQVPRFETVQKTRQVAKTRSVERMAPFFEWKVWDWAPARKVEAHGALDEPRWPSDAEVALGQGLAKGEDERATRTETFAVALRDEQGTTREVVPADEAEFRRWLTARAGTVVLTDDTRFTTEVPLPPSPRRARRARRECALSVDERRRFTFARPPRWAR
jgi:hypothetical protein